MITSVSKSYVLAVPGSDDTRSLSREAVLGELASGQITSDYWVWSPEDSDWKQISELAELQAPVLKPLPVKPSSSAYAPLAVQPIGSTVIYAVSTPPAPKKRIFRRTRQVDKEEEGFPYFKVLFALIYLSVAAVVAANYFIIDKSMDESLSHTPFVLVPAHAHLGSFVQRDALVIHVLPSAELTEENFADFLQALAKSTPERPFQGGGAFNIVTLSPAWFSQYALMGKDWEALAAMTDAKLEERQNFIVDHLCTPGGVPLIAHGAKLAVEDLKAARANVWRELTTRFVNR